MGQDKFQVDPRVILSIQLVPFISGQISYSKVSQDLLKCWNSILKHIQYIYIYIKRLGMFPFKVQLFQGCKSETEPINTKSCHAACYTIPSIVGGILQSQYQVLLLLCNMFVRSHCQLHYTHFNRLYKRQSIVGAGTDF
jgi:hypothetical protein